jgi:hypothetical protein
MTKAERILFDLVSWFHTGPASEEEALLIDEEEFSAKARDFNDIMEEAESYFGLNEKPN